MCLEGRYYRNYQAVGFATSLGEFDAEILEFFNLYIVYMYEGICIRSKYLYTNHAKRPCES